MLGLKKGLPEGQTQPGGGHRPGAGAAVERNEPRGSPEPVTGGLHRLLPACTLVLGPIPELRLYLWAVRALALGEIVREAFSVCFLSES